jgi:DNA-binding MarR family transcriptional regulator
MSLPIKNSKRFLVPRSVRSRAASRSISRKEISVALRAFSKKGGLIRRLPSQADERRPMVGNHRDSMYEAVIDFG